MTGNNRNRDPHQRLHRVGRYTITEHRRFPPTLESLALPKLGAREGWSTSRLPWPQAWRWTLALILLCWAGLAALTGWIGN